MPPKRKRVPTKGNRPMQDEPYGYKTGPSGRPLRTWGSQKPVKWPPTPRPPKRIISYGSIGGRTKKILSTGSIGGKRKVPARRPATKYKPF